MYNTISHTCCQLIAWIAQTPLFYFCFFAQPSLLFYKTYLYPCWTTLIFSHVTPSGIIRPFLKVGFKETQDSEGISPLPIRSIMIGPAGNQQSVFDSEVHRVRFGETNVWDYWEKRYRITKLGGTNMMWNARTAVQWTRACTLKRRTDGWSVSIVWRNINMRILAVEL